MSILDISSNNPHPIDYAAVKGAGVGGAVVKLTEGADASAYVNPYAAQDIAGFKALGIPVAGYHFLHPTISIPDQLALVRAHLDHLSFVWVDSETAEASWTAEGTATEATCAALHGVGIKTGLYSNPNFLDNMPGAPWGYDLWLADYGPSVAPRPCKMWQYTSSATVPGISGLVDLSHYYGDVPIATYFGPRSTTEDSMILTHLHDGQAVVVFPEASGYRPLGPEMQAWFESAGYAFKPPLPQNPPLRDLGPFSAA